MGVGGMISIPSRITFSCTHWQPQRAKWRLANQWRLRPSWRLRTGSRPTWGRYSRTAVALSIQLDAKAFLTVIPFTSLHFIIFVRNYYPDDAVLTGYIVFKTGHKMFTVISSTSKVSAFCSPHDPFFWERTATADLTADLTARTGCVSRAPGP